MRGFAHQSGKSDFRHLAAELAEVAEVHVAEPRPLPRLVRPLVPQLATPRPQLPYGPEFLSQELQLARPLTTSRRAVAHVLYLEDGGLRHLLRIRRPLRRGILAATSHVPRSRLERQDEIPWLRYALRGLDLVVALCERQADDLRELADGALRVRVVPGGVNTGWWAPAADPAEVPPPERPFVLNVGEHLRSRELLVAVAGALERDEPDARLELVLGNWDWRPELTRDNVHWNDRMSDAELLLKYRQASVVVLAVEDATFNNALVEALACGKAVVAPDVGGVREYTGDAARLVPPGDAEAFAAAVLKLLGDEEERTRLERAARARALEIAVFPRAQVLVDAYREAQAARAG